MKYLAIDPGNVSGIAYLDTAEGTVPDHYEVGGGLTGFVDWYYKNYLYPDMVFIEDFIIRPDTHRKTREPDVYELLGWIKGECHVRGLDLKVFGPAEHTPFSDYKLKKKSKIVRLGWSAPSKDMHADSASSILLLGLTRHARPFITPLLKEITNED